MQINVRQYQKRILSLLNAAGREIYSLHEIETMAGSTSAHVRKIVFHLTKIDRLIRLKRGLYLYVPEGYEKHWSVHSFLVASHLVQPYAVAYWSALNHFQFTEQIPHTVFVQTTAHTFRSEITILGVSYKFVPVERRKIFGYTNMWIGHHKIQITDKEKTIVDCLDYPEHCGGIVEVIKGLYFGYMNKEISLRKILHYAQRLGNKTVLKRLGYVISTLGLEISAAQMREIHAGISKGYSLLDPSCPNEGTLNAMWKLKVNVPTDTLVGWRHN